MPRLRKSTLTEKMLLILERGIRSGKYVAGRRMPSTRDLADDFGVSQQVVKSAFGELEGKGLIISRERDGVYVNPSALVSGRLEFSLLTMRRKGHVFDYVGKILSTGDSSVWDGINLATRNISGSDCSQAIIKYELDKLKDIHPDCLIASLLPTSEDDLRLFASLGFPVVFFGDFPWLPDASAPFNQIVEDTSERADAFVEAAHAHGARSVVLVGGSLDRAYVKILRDAAAAKAAQLSMDLRYVEFTDGSLESDEIVFARKGCIDSILKVGRPDAILFDGFIKLDIFIDAIRAAALSPSRDILVVGDRELIPGTIFIESDTRAFSVVALDLMKELVGKPGLHFGRKVLRGLIKRRPFAIGGSEFAKSA